MIGVQIPIHISRRIFIRSSCWTIDVFTWFASIFLKIILNGSEIINFIRYELLSYSSPDFGLSPPLLWLFLGFQLLLGFLLQSSVSLVACDDTPNSMPMYCTIINNKITLTSYLITLSTWTFTTPCCASLRWIPLIGCLLFFLEAKIIVYEIDKLKSLFLLF